jgi:hypothetical protein
MQTPPEEYEGVVLGSVESGKYIAGLKRRREFEPSLLNENMSEIPVPITPVSRPKYILSAKVASVLPAIPTRGDSPKPPVLLAKSGTPSDKP